MSVDRALLHSFPSVMTAAFASCIPFLRSLSELKVAHLVILLHDHSTSVCSIGVPLYNTIF